MHLRHTAKAVSILNARIVLEMRLPNLASIQERQQMFRDGLLAGVRPGIVQTRIESGGRSLERFETHCAGHIRDAREPFRAEKGESADRVHRLCAVEQGESLLCFEMQRLKFCSTKRIPARHSFSLEKRLALADQA